MESRSSKSPNRAKRRKISVACDDCRARKVRCDGVQPVCGPCSKRTDHGAQCNYTGELEKRKANQIYISNLETRIKELEGAEGSQESRKGPTPISTPRPTLPSPTPRGTLPETPGTYRSFQSQGGINTPASQRDGVNAMMGAVEGERASQGFFGSSSAAGFMRQIKTAVDKKLAPDCRRSPAPRLPVSSTLLSTRTETAQNPVANYVLPPRKMADSLMEVYWDYVFPLYPFLISAQMKSEYAKIWAGETPESDENMLMCTLNVMFALASQLADFVPPTEREASADSFFSRAKGLFQFNLWDTGSAGLIQCLLLMAQYLQSTDSAHQCWIVTGLAIRNAQSLGLHLPETISSLQSFQEQQLARKIWHGCVLMDRVISMTFGRPAMITKASSGAIPLPAAVDEEFIPSESRSEASQPPDRPSIMAFFGKSLELYDIMNDVLESLYNQSTDVSGEDIHDFYFNNITGEGERTIFELDHCLSRWTKSIPMHLRGDSAMKSTNPIFCRQSIVLRARFLHVRILLFRPTLSRYCTIRDNMASDSLIPMHDSFPHRVALQCSIICVKAAQESIQLIYNNVPSDGTGGPLPAWWYNVLYVYTSATVLIAGRLCSAILAEVSEESITQSWNQALEILTKYQSYSTSARRCTAALEILYEQVASEGVPPTHHGPRSDEEERSATFGDMSFGEGMNTSILDSFEFPDFQDMSWLNSVPSNLY
ncbi:unnamed protein product [Penicillium olsonii]|nr:unnamed protein product [Penicillium olsonii]CAG7934300.1 unnamed protein product [Penicillium olsonii]